MPTWLSADAVILDPRAASMAAAVAAAVPALARATGLDAHALQRGLDEALRESDFAIGAGVAVPHAAVAELTAPVVAFVRLTPPIDVGALDRHPVDLVFTTLFPAGDPAGHLAFLAHLARLVQSRVFRDGMRAAPDPQAVVVLVDAAEARRSATPRAGAAAAPAVEADTALAIIALAGEKAVDSALLELLDAGLGDATILDAQSAQEAASREVPLFAGFRDIFGDPGGQRVIFAVIPAARIDEISAMVRRICEERQAARCELAFVPVVARWRWHPPKDAGPARGH